MGKCPAVGDSISLVAEPQHWTKRTDAFCHTLIAHVYALGRVNKKGVVTHKYQDLGNPARLDSD
jgi:hypothetical protein